MTETLQFTPETAEVEITEQERLERRVAMVQNFEAYVDGIEAETVDSGLIDYQKPVMFDMRDALRRNNGPTNNSSTIDQLTSREYIVMPPSGGKTVLIAKTMIAFGVGSLPSPESKRPLRALVLVPTNTALSQTMSIRDTKKGLKRHAPGLTVTAFNKYFKELSGDVVVMTYTSFRILVKSGELQKHHFDLIMCDEGHHTLGKETAAALEAYSQGKLIYDWTASSELESGRSIASVTGKPPVHCTERRPFIQAGYGSAIQVLGFATGHELHLDTMPHGNFTPTSLKPLRLSESRNAAIVEIAACIIAEEGLRGIINCIGGDSCAHAKLIAEMLDGLTVTDSAGNEHTIRATIVWDRLTPDEIDARLQGLEDGTYDVITQVELLTEAFDSEKVGFEINAAPTRSPRKAIQRLGRLFRKDPNRAVKLCVELLDNIRAPATKKRLSKRVIPYTAWHVLGEETFEQSVIVASPEIEQRVKQEMDRAAPEVRQRVKRRLGEAALREARAPNAGRYKVARAQSFSGLVAHQYAEYNYILVKEFLLAAQEECGAPPPGWPTLQSIMPRVEAMGVPLRADGIRTFLERSNRCVLAKDPASKHAAKYHVAPDSLAVIEAHDFHDVADENDNFRYFMEIVEELQSTQDIVRNVIQEKKLIGVPLYAKSCMRVCDHFTDEQFKIIEAEVATRVLRTADTTMTPITDLERETGWARQSIKFFLERHHGIVGEPLVSSKTGLDVLCVPRWAADIVRRHREHRNPVPQSGVRTNEEMGRRTGASDEVIAETAWAIGLSSRLLKGHYKSKDGSYNYTRYCSIRVANLIEAEIQSRRTRNTQSETSADGGEEGRMRGLGGRHAAIRASRSYAKPESPAERDKPPLGYVNLLAYLAEHGAPCDMPLISWMVARSKAAPRLWTDPSNDTPWGPTPVAQNLLRAVTSFPVAPSGAETPGDIGAPYGMSAAVVDQFVRQNVVSSQPVRRLYRKRVSDGSIGELTVHYEPDTSMTVKELLKARQEKRK